MTDLGRRRNRNSECRTVLLQTLFWPLISLDRVYHRLLFAISDHRTFDRFTLYSIENDQVFFAKAIEALELLKKVDSRRYQRAQRYLPILAHVRQGGNFYKHSAKAFYVHKPPDDAAFFASEIVHETTHAYLIDRGFRYNKNARERHERLCTKEQLNFIIKTINSQEHMPHSQKDELIRQWRTWFEERLASGWWHDKNVRKDRIVALREMLRELFRKRR